MTPYVHLYLAFIAGAIALQTFRFFPLTTILSALLVSLLMYRRYRTKTAVYVMIFILSFLYGELRHRWDMPAETAIEQIAGDDEMPFSGVVSDLPVNAEYGFIQPIRLDHPLAGGNGALFLNEPLRPGLRILGYGHMDIRKGRKNPGMSQIAGSLFIRPSGEIVVMDSGRLRWLPERLRWRLYKYLLSEFSPDTGALLSAIVIGHRDRGEDGLYLAYSKTGLAHLMSISGTHFGLFTFMVFSLIRLAYRRLPYGWLIRLTSRLSIDETAAILTMPFAVFYLLLSGGRVPALRSFIMINLFLVGLLSGRKGQWLVTLLIAASLIIIIDPASIGGASFQLSFIAVLFIGFILDATERHINFERIRTTLRKPLKLVLVTAGASIGTMPLVLYYFHLLPSMTLLTNLIFVPLICFIILPLGLFGGMVFLATGIFPISAILDHLSTIVNSAVIKIADYDFVSLPVHAFPAIFLPLIYATMLYGLMRRWRLLSISAACLILSIILTFYFKDDAVSEVTFLDVGQADGAVIRTSGGKLVVMDTGKTGKEVIAYLRYRGIRRVDALILSHAGHDHAGGLWNILRTVPVSEVWDNGLLIYSPLLPEGIRQRGLKTGEMLTNGRAEFLILHPGSGYYSLSGDDENNSSLVVKYQDGPLSVLFTGDIESDAEGYLLSSGRYLKSDILKVAHHGSYTSSTSEFLLSVSPNLAVISVGNSNPYGHPHNVTMERLRQYTLKRTDRDGAVKVFTDGDGRITVRRYADYMLKKVKGLTGVSVKSEIFLGLSMDEEIRNLSRLFLLW